jgi:signal transduction histidine kinase
MSVLSRLFQSVGGQLLLLLLIAVFVTQGLSLLLFSDERNRAVRAAMGLEAAGRAANVALLLDEAPQSLQSSILRSADSPLVRFRLGDKPTASPENNSAKHLLAQIRRILGGRSDTKIYGEVTHLINNTKWQTQQMPPEMRPMHEAMRAQHTEPVRLVLSIELSDGRWLNVQSMFHRPGAQWSQTSVFSLLLMVGAIVIVVWVMGRRIVRPMNALAEGAERLGRGMETEPLPVTGPREVRDTIEAFNRMQTRLTRFVSDRTQLLAALGHDLRSPLTAMRIRLELLEESEDSIRLSAMVDEMQTMVEATLEFARSAAQSEPMAEVDMADLLYELVEDVKVGGSEASLSTAKTLLLTVRPTALKRALRNLIDNAIRYAGSVDVRLSQVNGMAQIEFADHGPGLPDDQMARVFEPFVRLEDSRNRDTGGTGLGLAIARTIVQSHGGNIVLSNRPEGGLLATVQIPRAPI